MDSSYFVIKHCIYLLILWPIPFDLHQCFVVLAVISNWESSREGAAAAAPCQGL